MEVTALLRTLSENKLNKMRQQTILHKAQKCIFYEPYYACLVIAENTY